MKVFARLRALLVPGSILAPPPALGNADALSGPSPRLRLVPLARPGEGPSGLVLVRGGEAFVLDYAEVLLLEGTLPRLLDALARSSPHYGPADLRPPAETLH